MAGEDGRGEGGGRDRRGGRNGRGGRLGVCHCMDHTKGSVKSMKGGWDGGECVCVVVCGAAE